MKIDEHFFHCATIETREIRKEIERQELNILVETGGQKGVRLKQLVVNDANRQKL
jgi:hypothetical protein